jgi:serine/threonine protein kinase
MFHQIVRLTYFSEDLSKHVITQVAKAIEYLHETSGVVHRYVPVPIRWLSTTERPYSDIKPENILFFPTPFIPSKHPKPQQFGDEDKEDEGEFTSHIGAGGIGEIKIADFGLSKIIWDTRTTTPCGTVGYTAPEIAKDEHYSKGVDMWALGCVLYTFLCGYPPFYDENLQVLTEKSARGQFVFLSPWWDHVSKSAQDLVSRLLTVDPEKRYTIKEFMGHPWIRQTDRESIVAAEVRPLAPIFGLMSHTGLQSPELVFADQNTYHPVSAGILNVPSTAAEHRTDSSLPHAFNLRKDFDVHCAVHRQHAEDKHHRNTDQENSRCCPLAGSHSAFTEKYDENHGSCSWTEFSNQPPSNVATEKLNDSSGMWSIIPETQGSAAQSRQVYYQPQAQCHGQHDVTVATTVGGSICCKSQKHFDLSLDGATLLQKRKHSTQCPLVE